MNKIQICDYSSKNIDKVKNYIDTLVVSGANAIQIKDFFSGARSISVSKKKKVDSWRFGKLELKIPKGELRNTSLACEKQNENYDIWNIITIEDTNQKVIKYQLLLTYKDENFALRKENLNYQRYLSGEELRKAVQSLLDNNDYTINDFLPIVESGGFLQNKPEIEHFQNDSLIIHSFISPVGLPSGVYSYTSLIFSIGTFIAPGRPVTGFSLTSKKNTGEVLYVGRPVE